VFFARALFVLPSVGAIPCCPALRRGQHRHLLRTYNATGPPRARPSPPSTSDLVERHPGKKKTSRSNIIASARKDTRQNTTRKYISTQVPLRLTSSPLARAVFRFGNHVPTTTTGHPCAHAPSPAHRCLLLGSDPARRHQPTNQPSQSITHTAARVPTKRTGQTTSAITSTSTSTSTGLTAERGSESERSKKRSVFGWDVTASGGRRIYQEAERNKRATTPRERNPFRGVKAGSA
jgi:hypothetical protein